MPSITLPAAAPPFAGDPATIGVGAGAVSPACFSGAPRSFPPEKRAGETAPAPTPIVAGSPAKGGAAAGKVIDGIMVRGLYLYNPKQQEIVVDYRRNLAKSPFFTIDPRTPERVIKSNSVPNDTEWAFPYELQLTLKKPVKLP